MSAVSGIVAGALGLSLLELAVTTTNGNAITQLFALPGLIARWWVDPNQPLIADRRNAQTKGLENALFNAYSQGATNPAATTNPPPPGTIPTPATPVTLKL